MYMVLMTLNIVRDAISGRSCLATWKRLPAESPEAVSTAQTGGQNLENENYKRANFLRVF